MKEMKKGEIEETLQEKKYDRKIQYYLMKFLEEFDELFGSFTSKQDVIERIKNNIKNIKWVDKTKDEEGEYLGLWKADTGEIFLNPCMGDRLLGDVFFHEMIHAIRTDQEGNIGLSSKYAIDGVEEKMPIGIALEEGFTQFVTNIRNIRYANLFTGRAYDIEEKFLDIIEIDKKELVQIGIKEPETIVSKIALAIGGNDDSKTRNTVLRLLCAMDDRLHYELSENISEKEREEYSKNSLRLAKYAYINLRMDAIENEEELCRTLINCNELSMMFSTNLHRSRLEQRISQEDIILIVNTVDKSKVNIGKAVEMLRGMDMNYLARNLEVASGRKIKREAKESKITPRIIEYITQGKVHESDFQQAMSEFVEAEKIEQEESQEKI